MTAYRTMVFFIAGALALFGEYLAAATLLLGYEIGEYLPKEPKPVTPKPGCFEDYPFLHPHIAAERDCGECPHAYDCYDKSDYHSPSGRHLRGS